MRLLFGSIGLVCGLLAGGATFAAELRDVRIEHLEGEDRVSMVVTEQVPLAVFILSAPDRVVADFERLSMGPDVALANLSGRWVSAVRHGMHAGGKLRLVFDLSGAANVDMSFDHLGSGGVFVLRLFSAQAPVEAPVPQRSDALPPSQQDEGDPNATPEDARAAAEAAAEALIRSRIGAPGTMGAPPDGFRHPEPIPPPVKDDGWRTLPLPPSMLEESEPIREPEPPADTGRPLY
ncbi:MAG: AMIN domain-containing protein [Rhodocyclales bacterium]|nr:AMIN domain-containing protein [Rhodocyclales bacterium]